MIQVKNLSFQYSDKDSQIKDVSFHLEKGSVMGLLGHNGSGKSTLMKLIGGLLRPIQGEILYEGKEIRKHDPPYLYRKMSLLIEEPSLYPHLSIFDNLKIRSLYHDISEHTITDVLNVVDMQDHAFQKVSKLSSGMKQRVGLAAALLPKPETLILDEPTNGMDPEGIVEIRNLILDLKRKGKTLLVSSHQLSEVEKVADSVLILKNGRLVFLGDMSELKEYRDLESFYLKYA
jgi:ABC-2 type transport system ATP-binding protein